MYSTDTRTEPIRELSKTSLRQSAKLHKHDYEHLKNKSRRERLKSRKRKPERRQPKRKQKRRKLVSQPNVQN
jgi:hypothetical protein